MQLNRRLLAESIMLLLMVAAVVYTYVSTKVAFRAVGYNDGVSAANFRVIETARRAGAVTSCKRFDPEQLVELASSKSLAIYVAQDAGAAYLCEYP